MISFELGAKIYRKYAEDARARGLEGKAIQYLGIAERNERDVETLKEKWEGMKAREGGDSRRGKNTDR
jgi:hypothetical protein